MYILRALAQAFSSCLLRVQGVPAARRERCGVRPAALQAVRLEAVTTLPRAGDAYARKGVAAALRTLQSDLVAKLV